MEWQQRWPQRKLWIATACLSAIWWVSGIWRENNERERAGFILEDLKARAATSPTIRTAIEESDRAYEKMIAERAAERQASRE
jgi:hypothetical protein